MRHVPLCSLDGFDVPAYIKIEKKRKAVKLVIFKREI